VSCQSTSSKKALGCRIEDRRQWGGRVALPGPGYAVRVEPLESDPRSCRHGDPYSPPQECPFAARRDGWLFDPVLPPRSRGGHRIAHSRTRENTLCSIANASAPRPTRASSSSTSSKAGTTHAAAIPRSITCRHDVREDLRNRRSLSALRSDDRPGGANRSNFTGAGWGWGQPPWARIFWGASQRHKPQFRGGLEWPRRVRRSVVRGGCPHPYPASCRHVTYE
jgi:hypothetical protein